MGYCDTDLSGRDRMTIKAIANSAALKDSLDKIDLNQFYSVEFSVDNLNFLYQFKIWSSPASPIFVLIKNGSEMLDKIKAGDILKMKYYSTDSTRPTCHFETQILDINWNQQGRFKGHYAVNLSVLDNQRTARA